VVLAPTGILKNKSATCYPGMENYFGRDIRFKDLPVVSDGNIITSRGAGTAFIFALSIVEKLYGNARAEEIRKDTVFYPQATG